MRLAPTSAQPLGASLVGRWLAYAALFAIAVAIAIGIATTTGAPSLVLAVGAATGIAAAIWMFSNERIERSLLVLLLYLGLLDGYLKLKTDLPVITLARDALFYAVAIGMLARALLRRQSLKLPPLSGWALAFVAVALAQLANPQNFGVGHTVGALRPHLEFIPLFFIGYVVMQTRARLQTFFVVLLVIAVANGVVGMIQLNLSPAQLASWGPGYEQRVYGTGTGIDKVSARVYSTASGETRTRPFGLGSDSGSGALWGMLALGGALALITLATRRSSGRLALVLCVGPPLAVISGQGRSILVASVVALLAYAAFATTAKRLVPTVAGVLVGLVAVVGVIAFVGATSGAGVFDRYATVTPSKAAATTQDDRGKSLARIPKFVTEYPLGNGLGSVGPATGFAGGGASLGSDGETEPTFLLSELGIPGLIVMLGFHLHLLWLGVTRIRLLDTETRVLVAALLAGIVGLSVQWISAATTATSPGSPYLWFVGGALSYWLVTVAKPERSSAGDARAAVSSVMR